MISDLLPTSVKDFSVEFPHRRQESWRYLDLTSLKSASWVLPSSLQASDEALEQIEKLKLPEALHLVFFNGLYKPELSSVEKVEGLTFNEKKREEEKKSIDQSNKNYFSVLSSLLSESLFEISVESEVQMAQPLQVIHYFESDQNLAKDQATFSPQYLQIHLAENSQLKILTTFPEKGRDLALRSQLMDITVSRGAELHLCQCHTGLKSYLMNHIRVQQEEKSSFFFVEADLQNEFVRNEVDVSVEGSFCETSVDGFYLTRNDQVVDNHTVIDQKKPQCQTHQLYKGILTDRSHGIFDGKIIIRKDSQKIEAEQLNNNLLVGSQARMDTKPNLEIFADDVKASHGATVGQLEEQELFYLQSRGISRNEALQMVSFGFLADVSYRIKDQKIRHFVEECLKELF